MSTVDKPTDEDTCVTKAKKFKSENDDKPSDPNSVHESLKDLSKFELKRILQNNAQKKLICVEGKFKDHEGSAIVLLEKKAFVEEGLDEYLFNETSKLVKEFENDLYGNYNCFPSPKFNSEFTTHAIPIVANYNDFYSLFYRHQNDGYSPGD